LDGDGKPDLAVANGSSSTVSIFHNTSTSGIIDAFSFSAKIDFTTGSTPYSIAIGDLNGDGKPDLAVVNGLSTSISIFQNTSSIGSITTGSFATKVDFTGGTPLSIAIADLDGDGKPDLVVTNQGSNTVSVLRNTDLPATITSFTPTSAKPGDAVTITGSGFHTTTTNNIVFFGATRATVTASTATSMTVTVPNGATYAAITELNTGTSMAAYSLSKFNPTYTPAKSNITASDFSANVDFTTGSGPFSIAIGDLDGDGKPDLAVANRGSNTVSIFRNISNSGSLTTGSFAAPVDFTTGSNPISVAIGDLDGDGKPDLAVTNYNSSTVSIFRNISSSGSITAGSFAAKVDFATGGSPYSVAVGDLDGDGKLDLAVANYLSNTISILQNTSIAGNITAGSFAAKVDFTTGTNPNSVAIGDIDGDGKFDIVVVNLISNTVSVYHNTSNRGNINTGSFAAPVDFATGGSPYSVAIGDLDGDGKPDLAVVNQASNTVSIFRNTASTGSITTGSFAVKVDFSTGTQPFSVAIGDLDGDSKPDLAVANVGSNNVSVLRNTSSSGSITTGSFAAKVDFPAGVTLLSVAIGDLDGDGRPDLTATSGSGSFSVLRNTNFIPPVISSFSPTSAKPGDAVTITGTGFNSTTTNNIVFFGATRATVTASTTTSLTVTVPIGATYAAITELNTVSSLKAYSMSYFTPTYTPAKTSITTNDFSAKVDFAVGIQPYSIAIGDLDGDGKPDVVIANQFSNTISILRNISSSGSMTAGSFAAKVDFATGLTPYSVAIGDIDGDGKPDLAVTNSGSNTVSILRNTSSSGIINTGSFAAKVDFATGSFPYSVAIGDLDGDGKSDLAVTNINSNTVSILQNTSGSGSITTGSFAAKVDFVTGLNPYSLAIGDLDGDGKSDLAVANYNSSTTSLFRNISSNGIISTGSFAAKVDFTTGVNPYSIAIGDIDGDGKLDLATANVGSNNVSVLRNTSSSGSINTGSFAAKVDFATGSNPYSIAIGDMDGDGKLDLATANVGSNSVSVLGNTSSSGSITTGSFAAKVDFATGLNPYSLAIGDLDGDGMPDLIATNSGSTTVSVIRNRVVPPVITSFSPTSAKPGDAVTITGIGFNTTTTNNIVFFGATRATVTASTATSLTVTVPTGTTYAAITELNTVTGLAAYSLSNFAPTYTPAKTSITATDFAAKVDFNTGTQPASVGIGDLDGDGLPDLAIANAGSNTVSIYHNISSSGSITTGSFAAKVDFATGSSPISVKIGDFDGDGKPDLAVTNFNSNTVSIFRNTSSSGNITTGSFAAKVDFATGSNPSSIAIGDLDGDGKFDLAVTNFNSNTVSILRNTSSSGIINTGSFAAKVDFTTGTNPNSLAIGDLDGDSKPDLAVANYGSNTVSVYRNISSSGSITTGSFAAKVDFATGALPFSVAIGDLDGDGKPDLAVTNSGSNTVSVLHNTSSSGIITVGSFDTKVDFTTGTTPWSVAIGDLDGDGKPDLEVANSGSNTVSVLRNTSSSGSITIGSFATKVDFTTGTNPASISIGDLDGDGKPDLAVANQGSNTVSVIRNVELPPTITSFTPTSAKPGDVVTISGTGFHTTTTNNIVFFGATQATVTASTATSITVTVPTGATYAPIRELNKGKSLAAYSLSNFTPTYSPAKTSITTSDFSPKVDISAGLNPYSVAIGDLDGDGKPDLAVTNAGSSTVSLYRNISSSGSITTGSFAAKVDFTTGTQPYSIAIGDLDGDGRPDLAVANYGSNTVSVYRNISSSGSITTGSFAAKVDFATGSLPFSVAIGDLDGDGKPDLAVTNRGSNTVSVIRNTSSSGSITTGSFAAKQDFTTGSDPWSIAISDLDGDGKPDLAVVNYGSNTVSLFSNTSSSGSITTGSFASKVDFTTGTGPYSIAIGDLDGDGKFDLAVSNLASNNVSVYRNTSSIGSITISSFATKVDFTTGIDPCSVTIGDLDGDGKPDLTVTNNGSNTVSVIRNTSSSGSIITSSFAAKVDFATGTNPRSVAIGDLDGDGKPDLVVPNYSSSNVSVLRNANLTSTITSFTPTSGPVGTLVTITGTNLTSPTALTIGGVSAILISNDGTTLVAMVMPGATTGTVSVTTALGTANGTGNFNIIASLPPNTQQGAKLVGTGAIGTTAEQGFSVSISADGNTAIVGGKGDNSNVGAAWIYTRSGGVWTQEGVKLVGTGAVGAASQGMSVSLSADGNTAIVGGVLDNSDAGAAWVYTRSGGTWTQQGAKLVGTGATFGARQGFSVSLSADGNTAIVGGGDDNSFVGAAWVYTRSSGTWSQQGAKLVGTGAQGSSLQGRSVSLSADGNTAIVGGNNDNGAAGAVWVYTRSGGLWTQQGAKLVGTGAIGNGRQGFSVALSADGNTAIVGGDEDNNFVGATWVYTRSGSIWTQQGTKLVGTGAIGTAWQGYSVSLSADGNTAMVGGYEDNSPVGAAWMYTRSGGVWTQSGNKLVGTGVVGNSSQGWSASLSADGNTAIVGGPRDNSLIGAAWAYTYVPPPTITSATYNTVTGVLAITGTNLVALSGVTNDVAINKFTLTGEGGITYTLTSANVEITNATSFIVTLNATDIAGLNLILNKNGTSSTGATTYNLAAASDWMAASLGNADLTGNGITVSNVAVPTITSSTYDIVTGSLIVTGTGLLNLSGSANDIDVTKLTFTGQGGGTFTLTGNTSSVEITNATSFTVSLGTSDKIAVNALLNSNGTSSVGGTTYNLAAAEDWNAGADPAVVIADLTGNGITVSSVATITSTGTLAALTTTYGTASGNTSFSVSGATLTNDIVVTAPTGFEVSVSSGVGFGNTVTLTQAAGTVASTTIYVRLKANNTVAASPFTGNVSISSANATTVNVATASSTVTAAALTVTANNVNKTYGSTLTGGTGSIAFTSVGLLNGETIGSVTIAYGTGSSVISTVGTYTGSVTASAATGGSFTISNYNISYFAGDITVSAPVVPVAEITGTLSTCIGASTTLSNATVGGVWSSDDVAIATVNNAGVVSGVSAGMVSIKYTVTEGLTITIKSAVVTVTDCSGVPGGGGGGLESKSLGDAVGNRIFNKAVNSLQGQVDYAKLPVINGANKNKMTGVGTSLTLSEILPSQIAGTKYKVFNSTPADIASITNAKDVLSIDFTLNDQAKAVAFGTKTQGEVYDHTKAICDRLKGSELINIENVLVNNIKMVRYDLKNTKGQIEYAFSFVIGAKSGRSNYTIQSNWLNKDYTADEVMYNIQLWAETPSLIMNMATDMMNRLTASMPVKEVLSNGSIPKTYVSKGNRDADNIVMNITNTTAGTNGYFEVKVKDNEQSSGYNTKQVPFTITTNGKASVKVPVGDSYEASINMYLNNVMTDQLFMTDGNWATASLSNLNSVSSFKVSNDPKRIADNKDDYLVYRNIQMEAAVTDYISVYKILRGAGAAQDLTGYKSLLFNAKTTGVNMKVILIKEGISNWADQYTLEVPMSDNTKDVVLNLNDFVSTSTKDKINLNDITTIIFSLMNPSGKMVNVTADISNVAFSKTDFAYLNSLKSTELNAYPNPSNGRFTVTFKSPNVENLTLTVRDAATGIPVLTKLLKAQIGENTVPVSIERKTGLNTYILTLESSSVKYNTKKVFMDK
jgi:hypothetical protein